MVRFWYKMGIPVIIGSVGKTSVYLDLEDRKMYENAYCDIKTESNRS